MSNVIATAVVFVSLTTTALAAESYVWFEAEAADSHTFGQSNAFRPSKQSEKDILSGGAWLQTDRGSGVTGKWTINVTTPGEYSFWTRKFWKHGPFKFRWNGGAWGSCGKDCSLADSVEMRKHVCANWVALGSVTLKRGRNVLEIRVDDGARAAAFDCFLVTRSPFTPNGAKKPGEKYGLAEEGWFSWEPVPDPFTNEALIDLRGLNQKHAGEDGFVQAKGMDFVFERTGEKVKFWAVNAGAHYDDHASVDFLARRLAKLGVNMVRCHSAIFDKKAGDPATINTKYLDQLHYFVSSMAKQGIYTKLSIYFPIWFDVKPNYGLPGYDTTKNKRPFALLFFHPRMQQIHRAWLRGLMTTRNPYTGKPFADDPAVAIVEILNEDNYFFWTFKPYGTIPAECMHVLEKQFGDWLTKKYGSLARAQATWGDRGRKPRGDDFAQGRVGIYDAGHLTGQNWAVNGRNAKRAEDTVRFLTYSQRKFYADTTQYLRRDLGVKCTVSATNWKTADNRVLGALDKYTNMACDVIDRHGYFGSSHKGDAASYSVRKGHTYKDTTALYGPKGLTQEIQYVGHPHIVSEFNYPMPNRYRAEHPWLTATYGSLGGTDGFYFFALGMADWQRTHTKFSIYTPVVMGQFPAAALMYRNGLVSEGPVVYHAAAKLDDLYALKGTPVAEAQNLDKLRAADIPAGRVAKLRDMAAMDPLSYFVGQVTINVAKSPGMSSVMNMSKYIDRNRKVVKSATGELEWDWGRGVVKLTAAKAQGACGFLGKAGKLELGDVSVDMENEYAAVLVVSMDDAPLRSSKKMLLQIMTEDRNYGWKTSGGDAKRIEDLGSPPVVVRDIKGRVSLKRSDASRLKVIALDQNGYAREKLAGSASSIKLMRDCVWYVIQK